MSRMYEVTTGKRFDANHPLWKQHMVNKDKSIKKRMDNKKAAELESQGLITLVPSTTEIASYADAQGAFSAGSNWGAKMCQDAYEEWYVTAIPDLRMQPNDLKSATRTKLTEARDKGSELHDIYDSVKRGTVELATLNEDQQKFYGDCCDMFKVLGVEQMQWDTEIEFANPAYGGTVDVDGHTWGLDWKTVSKQRPLKASEKLQIAAYANHFGWEEAWICQWDQGARKMLPPHHFIKADLAGYYEIFVVCLTFHKLLRQIA